MHFHNGRFNEAIKLYEEILKLEDWPRAREQQGRARKYLESGIPSILLPPELGILYGKAISFARARQYDRAYDYMSQAIHLLKTKYNLIKWDEGLEFYLFVENEKLAYEYFHKGIEKVKNGDLEGAIDALEYTCRLSSDPLYKNAVDELRQFRVWFYASWGTLVNVNLPSVEDLQGINEKLNHLPTQVSDYPGLEELRKRVKVTSLRLADKLTIEAERALVRSRRSNTLAEAREHLEMAISALAQQKCLPEPPSQNVKNPQSVDDWRKKFEIFESTLQQAESEYEKHPSWPINAWKLSRGVQAHFYRDERVIALESKLKRFRWLFQFIGFFGKD